jgi:hypothetical protein
MVSRRLVDIRLWEVGLLALAVGALIVAAIAGGTVLMLYTIGVLECHA